MNSQETHKAEEEEGAASAMGRPPRAAAALALQCLLLLLHQLCRLCSMLLLAVFRWRLSAAWVERGGTPSVHIHGITTLLLTIHGIEL